MRNGLSRILALCLLCALLAGGAATAMAAEKPSIQADTLWVGSPKRSPILLDLPESAEVVSIKSANPAMLKVGKQAGFGPWGLWMRPLKVGRCKITVRYRLNGKARAMSQVIRIKKYPNPFAWIKVNGKKVNLEKYPFEIYRRRYAEKRFTVAFRLNKNWKLEGCNGAWWKGDVFQDALRWSNGKSCKLPAGYTRACAAIDARNAKTGDFFNYEVWFVR